MLSLLPQQLKKEVQKEYRLRLVSVACFLLAAVGALSAVALVPYIALSSIKEKAVEAGIALHEKDAQTGATGDFSADVARTKLLINTYAGREGGTSAQTLVERLVRVLPSDVSLSSIAIARTSSSTAQVIAEGVAVDRDALLFFVQELKKVPILKSVVLPVSNFAKAEDIEFSLTMISSY
jgi:hypothetical protein